MEKIVLKKIALVFAMTLLTTMCFATGSQGGTAVDADERITFYYVAQDRRASAPGDEEVREFINEKFNVDYRRIDIPQAQIGEKMAIMIAAGDQIDFFPGSPFGSGTRSLPTLVENNVVQPVNEFLEKYGQNLMKELPEELWKYVTYDGKIMGVPDTGFKSKIFLYVRTDWMDNLDIDPPKTIIDFEAMLVKMRDNDPDGTGLDARYPLVMMAAQSYLDGCFLSAFIPTGNSWYVQDEGKLVPPFFHPGFKDYMATLQRWYNEKLIHPDVMIMKREDVKSVIAQGVSGVQPAWYSLSYQDEVKVVNPEAEMGYIWWPTGPSGTSGAMSQALFNTLFLTHVSTPKKVVARVFQIIDWFQTPEGTNFQWYGIEGKHWVKEDGVISTAPGIDPERPAYKGQLYINAGAAWKYFSESSLVRPPLMSDCRQVSIRGDYPTIDAVDYMYPYDWSGTKTQDLMSDLDKMYSQMFAKVIIGALPLLAIDDFIQEWMSKGGDIYIEERTAQFNAIGARYK